MNLIQTLEAEAVEALTQGKEIPAFRAGDTLRVGVRVVEGTRTRTQNFEGVCIARSNRGINSNFTVRKMSFGEGVERVFPLYSPNIESVTVVRRGVVRRLGEPAQVDPELLRQLKQAGVVPGAEGEFSALNGNELARIDGAEAGIELPNEVAAHIFLVV